MTSSSSRCIRLALIGLAFSISAAQAATFDVTNPSEFQSALTAAQSNGQNDIINVAVCAGAGCVGGAYQITTPLTYTADASESFSLTIDGFDSDTRILDGGGTSSILRIDNLPPDDSGAQILVRNMTMRNGNASGGVTDGGALWIVAGAANIEITGSVFENNVASDDGGAVFVRSEELAEAFVLIQDVTFDSNQALGTAGDGAGDGGGAHVGAANFNLVQVVDTDFIDNEANGDGGGIEIEGLDPVDIQLWAGSASFFDVGFTGNTAVSTGGGAVVAANNVDLDTVGFVGNIAARGGGLHIRRDVNFFSMVNTGFAGNEAGAFGGGLAIDRNMGPTISMAHNTFYRNRAVLEGGGMWIEVGGSTGLLQISNNIIYDNIEAPAGRDVYVDNDPFTDIPVSVTFINNDITDLMGFPDSSTSFFITSSTELTASDNIDAAPILPNIDSADPDPSQGAGSPTIDAGTNSPPGVFTNQDFEGDTRPLDGDGNGSVIADIGMDEFVPGALPSADLSITKTASANPIEGGMDLTYSITVANNGPDAASGVTVTDTLDADVTFVSASFDQGTACTTMGTPVVVTCALGTIASGADSNGTVVVTTSAVTTQDSIGNTASVSGNETDPLTPNNTVFVSTTVVPPGPAMADVAVTAAAAPNPVFSGGPELTFTLTVDNNGPDPATAVVLTDTVPAGTSFVSVAASAGTGCTDPDGMGDFSCALGDLAAMNNATVTLVVMPDVVTSPTDIANNAAVSATEDDPIPGNNTASATVTVNPPESDMRIAVSATPEEPLVGDTITFTIVITNDGPSDDTGVFVDIMLPSEVMVGDVSSTQGSCDSAGDPVNCQIGDLADGASVTITVTVTAPMQPQTLMFEATVGGDIADPLSQNNSGTFELSVIDAIDIIVRGVGGSGSFGPYGLALLLAAAAAVWLARARGPGSGGPPLLLLAAVSVGFLVPSAKAQSQDDWYVGASIGTSDADYSAGELQSDLAARGWTISNPSTDDSDTAWKVYGGYALTDLIAVELGYANLGEVDTQYGASVPPNQIPALLRDTVAVHPYLGEGWFAAGVLRWPLVPNQWSVTARAGLFAWEADIDVDVIQGATGSASDKDTGTDGMLGIGIEWHANPQWSVTLEWERYKLNDWVDVPSIGVRWRF